MRFRFGEYGGRYRSRIKPEPVLATDKARQVADQRAMRQQRPLGRAGGTAGVNQNRRFVGAGCHRRKTAAVRGRGAFVIDIALHGTHTMPPDHAVVPPTRSLFSNNATVAPLAWADHGRSWHKYGGNPVLDAGLADFRDPNVFWHAASARWIMVVALSARNCAAIYASHDLKAWEHLSDISGSDAPGEVWECPLLIELPVEGEAAMRWLFKVDVLRGAPGSGAIYATGTFDGEQFRADPQGWAVLDAGSDFYAAIAWHEPRDEAGRPVWIGWLGNHAYQGQLPLQGWRGAMSLPRHLSLRRIGQEFRVRQEAAAGAISAVTRADLTGSVVPAAARIELPGDRDFKLQIEDGEGRKLQVERRASLLLVTRRDPALSCLDTVQQLGLHGAAAIEVWLDVGSLELLADDGCAALSVQHRLSGSEFALDYVTDKAST